MGTEKRSHPRFPLILAVDYPGAASTVRDYTENLSAGGLFIRTEREFEVGERLSLLISFPELLEPAELEVEVVRMRPGRRVADARAWRSGSRPTGSTTGAAWSGSSVAAAAQAESSRPGYRVLLVEDNSLVAAMYASALRRLAATEGVGGLAVDVAVDGNEAFARLHAQPPIDLIITDVYMPVMSGFALVEKVRAEPRLRHLPIIVISSAGDEERERVSRLGANFFLQKPVKYQDIVATVRTLLRAGPQPGAPMSTRQVPTTEEHPNGPSNSGRIGLTRRRARGETDDQEGRSPTGRWDERKLRPRLTEVRPRGGPLLSLVGCPPCPTSPPTSPAPWSASRRALASRSAPARPSSSSSR